jgi:hypothetical protein
MKKLLRSTLVLSALAGLTACGGSPDKNTQTGDGDGGSGEGGPTTVAPPLNLPSPTADITWAPGTTYVDEMHASLVKSVDPTTFKITLDSAAVKAANLDLSQGRIIVIYGQAMRTITSASDDGTNVTLETGPASLADAATDAELDWQQAVELSPEAAKGAGATGMRRIVRAKNGLTVDNNHVAYVFPDGEYTFTIDMVLGGDTATVSIEAEKEISGGVTAKFTATGQISRFVDHHHVSIKGGQLQSYETDNNHVQGNLTLTAVAAASNEDSLTVTLPVPLLEYTILVGPIPVEMTVGAEFVIKGVVPAESSVDVQSVINYDSDLGFSYGGTSVSASGSIGSYSIEKGDVTQSGSPSDVGFNAGMGFPRIGVSAFGSSLVGSIQTAFVVGGSYTFFPACQTADAAYLASYEYDLSILGAIPIVSSGDQTIFEVQKTLLSAGMCSGG